MAEQNLPALQQKAQSISDYLGRDYIKKQLAMALPKHLTADRLLRVAMTTIRHNRKLLDCTLESLLASVMGCAQLGLEPEPALGQAYLVPYWNNKKNCLEAQLIPGYRGYITLARRSGEVKNVSSQVVYTNDHFKLQYGLNETLDHIPADGDRGEPKGAYVVFRYKDGSHSFDYMTVADIDKIKARTKSVNKKGEIVGPWVTDEDEMRKKTVIRRHIKLVPLSVELATAAAAEEKAFAGESQAGLFLDTQEADFTEVNEEAPEVDPAAVEEFDRQVIDKSPIGDEYGDYVDKCVAQIAKVNKQTVEAVKAQAGTAANFPTFWESFLKWHKPERKPRSDKGTTRKAQDETAPTAPEAKETGVGGGTLGPRGITDKTVSDIDKELARTGYERQILLQDWEVTALSELSEEAGQNALKFLAAIPD